MRKCRHCKIEIPKASESNPIQRKGFCTFDHAADYGLLKAKASIGKKKRQDVRQAKEKIKTKGAHAKDTQAAFNAYIRARDSDLPCVSCGRHHQGQYHAGHYRTVGAHPELRFNENNCHKQCAPCNNHKSGNVVDYRINLADRIGAGALEWLEGPHDAKKYSIDDLKELTKYYRKKLREMAK
jgi:hypothetical protein